MPIILTKHEMLAIKLVDYWNTNTVNKTQNKNKHICADTVNYKKLPDVEQTSKNI